jgi:cytochrome b pre-mRNA-processing protein 3
MGGGWLQRRRERRALAHSADLLYVCLVEQARAPWLYAELGVPDSVDGRFDMIILHVWAAHRALAARPAPGPALAQRLVDTMFADMDRGLRELGAGDHGIARRLKQMIGAFHGRIAAYEAAGDDAALAAALARNVYRSTEPLAVAGRLAAYARRLATGFDAATLEDLAAARLPAPPVPEDIVS